MASSVSVTHGGLTTFTRTPRGNSRAAARANASTAAFTGLTAALPGSGSRESTPLVRVNEPPQRLEGGIAGGADESVEGRDVGEQALERIRRGDVHPVVAARPAHPDDLVALLEGFGHRFADRAGASDDDHLHVRPPSVVSQNPFRFPVAFTGPGAFTGRVAFAGPGGLTGRIAPTRR
jgi:hypothetical protein